LGDAFGIARESVEINRTDVGFRTECDDRCFAAMNFHRTDVNRNISSSVTVGLDCLSCNAGHSFKDSLKAGIPAVLFLTDQSFPPVLPAADKKCVVIIRVEDGLLSEIESAFCDLFAEFLTPNGGLPRGSLVLVGSVSHLGARGLDSYAGELCGTISSLIGKIGPSVEVIPIVPVPVAGIGGGGKIRELFDLDSWIAGSGLGPGVVLKETRRVFWEVALGEGEGASNHHGDRPLFIPATCRNPRRRPFLSPAPATPLPSIVAPVSRDGERRLILTLFDEINNLYGMGIDPNPTLERGSVTQGADMDRIRTVLVGASHMTRIADEIGQEVVNLAFPGFRPKEEFLDEIACKLSELKLGKKDTVVCDLLSNVVFMGTNSDGLPTEAVRAEDGSYHIVGSLTIAPPSLTKKILSGCSKLARVLKETGTVLVSPIPRYVFGKCCDNPDHIENFEDPELDEEVVSGLEGVKKILQNWAIDHDLCFEIIDPTLLSDTRDLGLRERTTSTGQRLWRRDDPVHLTSEGYRDIAQAVADSVVSGPIEDSASLTGSSKSSQKRKRAESVVTKHPIREAKRGSTTTRTAGWLLGRLENNSGNTSRGSGSSTRDRGGHRGRFATEKHVRGGSGRGGYSGWRGGWRGGQRGAWQRPGRRW
jgi:hypothetical protein